MMTIARRSWRGVVLSLVGAVGGAVSAVGREQEALLPLSLPVNPLQVNDRHPCAFSCLVCPPSIVDVAPLGLVLALHLGSANAGGASNAVEVP